MLNDARWYRRVLGYCRKRMNNEQDAREAAQEAFLRAHRSLPQYDPARPLEPWLVTIARHACIDELRRQRGRSELFVDDGVADVAILPDTSLDYSIPRLQWALSVLSPMYRQIVELVHYEDRGLQEIATELGLPFATVHSRLYRARRQLRAVYEGSARRDKS